MRVFLRSKLLIAKLKFKLRDGLELCQPIYSFALLFLPVHAIPLIVKTFEVH